MTNTNTVYANRARVGTIRHSIIEIGNQCHREGLSGADCIEKLKAVCRTKSGEPSDSGARSAFAFLIEEGYAWKPEDMPATKRGAKAKSTEVDKAKVEAIAAEVAPSDEELEAAKAGEDPAAMVEAFKAEVSEDAADHQAA